MDKEYIIKWKSKITGEEGQGEPISKRDADEWLKKMEAECPEIDHWIEPVI